MDLKVMPKLYKGHKFILCVIDELTNYCITMPIYQGISRQIRRSRGCIDMQHHIKVWHTRLHDNGSGHCIYVYNYKLLCLRD